MKIMEFLKKIIWAGITIAIIYFGYQAYVNWWSVGGGSLEEKKQIAEQYVEKKKAEVGQKVTQTATQVAGGVVSEAKKGVLDYFKEKVSDGLTSVGNGLVHSAESLLGASSTGPLNPLTIGTIGADNTGILSVPSGIGFSTPAVPATVATKVNVPVIFSVNRGVSYSVNWGDKTTDSGTVDSDSVKLLSHAWQSEGDFIVSISIRGGGVSQDYSFPIRVYP